MGASQVIRYLLDTNTVTYWLGGRDRGLVRRAAENRRACAISAIVLHELWFGALNGDRPQQNIDAYGTMGLAVLPFDEEDARVAGEVRVVLKRAGAPIGPYDLLIAGQALARDLTLVTNNVREFGRVDGLRVVDWTSDDAPPLPAAQHLR